MNEESNGSDVKLPLEAKRISSTDLFNIKIKSNLRAMLRALFTRRRIWISILFSVIIGLGFSALVYWFDFKRQISESDIAILIMAGAIALFTAQVIFWTASALFIKRRQIVALPILVTFLLIYIVIGTGLNPQRLVTGRIWISLMQSLLEINISLLVFCSIFPFLLRPTEEPASELNYSLQSILNEIFSSNKFFSILRSAIPSADAGMPAGFEHIPYMLDALNVRREQSHNASKNYLYLTMTLGAVFSAVMITLGYALIDETLIGKGKVFVDLKKQTERIEDALKDESIAWVDRYNFEKLGTDILELRVQASKNKADHLISAELSEAISKFSNKPTMNSLNELARFLSEKHSSDQSHLVVYALLDDCRIRANSLQKETSNMQETLSKQVAALGGVIKTAEISIKEDRIYDLLRRISIGIAVATFLLALLRFSTNLYRQNIAQVLALDDQMMRIRKFCVAYQCFKDKPEMVKDLIAIIQPNTEISSSPEKPSSPDEASGMSIVKEVLSALAKKI